MRAGKQLFWAVAGQGRRRHDLPGHPEAAHGGFTIGDNSRIGAGSVVVREVPPNSVVVGVPGRVTYKDGQRVDGIDLNQTDLPDPVTKALEQLVERIRTLEAEVETLRKSVDKEERA